MSNKFSAGKEAFDEVINSLPISDQKDLFNLLIKEIQVWSFDPENEKAPKELGAFITKIRTKWFRIKLTLYQFPEIQTYYKSLSEKKASSDSTTKWLPGRDTQRTINRLTLHMPIHLIFNGNRALDIIEGQAPYGISTSERLTKTILGRYKPVICKPNPVVLALKYQKIYDHPDYQSMEKVAQEFGVSRVRIHQMLNLLKLDQRIIDYII